MRSSVRTLSRFVPYLGVINLFVLTATPLRTHAQQSKDLFGLGNKLTGDVTKKATDEISRAIGKAIGVDAPLKLDQTTAYPKAAELTDFHPTLLKITSLSDLRKHLAAGDYAVSANAYCTMWSIHAPGAGLPYKLAPLQGRLIKAVNALLVRGTVSGISSSTVQTMNWYIQGGVPLSQWPEQYRSLVHTLMPDYETQLQGDYIQQIQDKYDKFARIPGIRFPSFDALIANTGELGAAINTLRRGRQILADKAMNAERLPDLLYEPQADGLPRTLPPATDPQVSPWAEIQPGVTARYTIIQGNMGRNLLEFRVLPASDNAKSSVRLITTEPPAIPASPTLGEVFGMGELVGKPDRLLIGYSMGRAAQALIPLPIMPAPSDQNNSLVATSFDASQWELVKRITSPGDDTFKFNAGNEIAVVTSSDALLPTLQFYYKVTASPLNADGSLQESIATPDWFKPVEYSSRFTGGAGITAIMPQTVIQANSSAPMQLWTVTIPSQEDTNGNYSYVEVKIYVRKPK